VRLGRWSLSADLERAAGEHRETRCPVVALPTLPSEELLSWGRAAEPGPGRREEESALHRIVSSGGEDGAAVVCVTEAVGSLTEDYRSGGRRGEPGRGRKEEGTVRPSRERGRVPRSRRGLRSGSRRSLTDDYRSGVGVVSRDAEGGCRLPPCSSVEAWTTDASRHLAGRLSGATGRSVAVGKRQGRPIVRGGGEEGAQQNISVEQSCTYVDK